jgi:hypothetical protein
MLGFFFSYFRLFVAFYFFFLFDFIFVFFNSVYY